MRVTNKMLTDNFLNDMRTNLSNLNNIQGQMASGKQIQKASDDPAKASKIMQLNADIAANKQYSSNIENTTNNLDATDTSLGYIGDAVSRIQFLLQGVNGTYTSDEFTAVKDEVNQKVGEISQLLNTSFDGKYLFGGTSGSSKPVDTANTDGNTELISNVKLGVVANQTNGTMTAANSLKANFSAVTLGTDKLTVDGKSINVDWDTLLNGAQKSQIQSNLSTATNSTLNSIKNTLVNAINSAIDNSGENISHISGSLDSNNNMVLKSGSTGVKSEVTLTTKASSTSIGANILSNTAGTISVSPNKGASTYSGNDVLANDTFNMSINGVSMAVTATVNTTKGSPMANVATNLQANITTAINNANVGKASTDKGFIKPVTVTQTDDGRLAIDSPSGTITFIDNSGKTTAKDLGLSAGSKDKLLVEVSQGVTMDYNVTATQVINYGTGSNNLMDLLANITKHLDSSDITSLTNADLTGITDALTNVSNLRSEVGAKQNRMESAKSMNEDQSYNMTAMMSTTQDIDITEKAMEYATMQNIYTASLQTSAKIIQPTLLDYLR